MGAQLSAVTREVSTLIVNVLDHDVAYRRSLLNLLRRYQKDETISASQALQWTAEKLIRDLLDKNQFGGSFIPSLRRITEGLDRDAVKECLSRSALVLLEELMMDIKVHTRMLQYCSTGNLEPLKTIASYIDIDYADDHGATALITACHFGHAHIVKYLLEFSPPPSVEFVDELGWSALMHAARNGHTDIVNTLLAADVNVNAMNNENVTVLMCATDAGHYSIVRQLINCGANVNAVSKSGDCALLQAIRGNHLSILKLLLANEASITPLSSVPPVLLAASLHRHSIVELLIAEGASLEGLDAQGRSVCSFEVSGGLLAKAIQRGIVLRLNRTITRNLRQPGNVNPRYKSIARNTHRIRNHGDTAKHVRESSDSENSSSSSFSLSDISTANDGVENPSSSSSKGENQKHIVVMPRSMSSDMSGGESRILAYGSASSIPSTSESDEDYSTTDPESPVHPSLPIKSQSVFKNVFKRYNNLRADPKLLLKVPTKGEHETSANNEISDSLDPINLTNTPSFTKSPVTTPISEDSSLIGQLPLYYPSVQDIMTASEDVEVSITEYNKIAHFPQPVHFPDSSSESDIHVTRKSIVKEVTIAPPPDFVNPFAGAKVNEESKQSPDSKKLEIIISKDKIVASLSPTSTAPTATPKKNSDTYEDRPLSASSANSISDTPGSEESITQSPASINTGIQQSPSKPISTVASTPPARNIVVPVASPLNTSHHTPPSIKPDSQSLTIKLSPISLNVIHAAQSRTPHLPIEIEYSDWKTHLNNTSVPTFLSSYEFGKDIIFRLSGYTFRDIYALDLNEANEILPNGIGDKLYHATRMYAKQVRNAYLEAGRSAQPDENSNNTTIHRPQALQQVARAVSKVIPTPALWPSLT